MQENGVFSCKSQVVAALRAGVRIHFVTMRLQRRAASTKEKCIAGWRAQAVRSGEPAPFGVTRVRVCFAAGNLRDSAGPVSLRSGISRFRSTHLPCCSNGYWESSDAPSHARMTSEVLQLV